MEEIIDFIVNNDVVLIMFLLAILTAVKQLLTKLDDIDSPKAISVAIKVLKKVAEYITANDGETN